MAESLGVGAEQRVPIENRVSNDPVPAPGETRDNACADCGRAHQPYTVCPEVADYHGRPDGFLKKYGS